MSEQPPRHRRGNGSGNGKGNGRSGGRGGASSGGFGRWLAGLGRRGRISLVVGAVIIVVLVGVVLAAVLSSGGTKGGTKSSSSTTSSSLGTLPSTSLPQVVTNSKLCPLTGLPAPAGNAPQRPALAVKIGNDPSSRPQSGLDQADIVYEEMAEGGITRYMAVYQCQNAPLIGPVRSVRWDDWNILEPYRQAILAYSGGIDPWMQEAATLPWIYNANGSFEPTANAYYRYSSSSPPASLGAPVQLLHLDQGTLGTVPRRQDSAAPALQVLQDTPGRYNGRQDSFDPVLGRLARCLEVESDREPVAALLRHHAGRRSCRKPAPHDEHRDPNCEDQVRALQRERAGQP